MLEAAQERISLLKAGINGKQIEELYILYNNFKVIGYQRTVKKDEMTTLISKNSAFCQEAIAEWIL